MVNRIKQFVAEQAIKNIIRLLPRFSKSTLIKLTYLAERVMTKEDPVVLKAIRETRKYFLENHPSIEIARKVFTQLSPHCRRKFVENLFINAMFKGVDKAKEFKEEYGFEPPWFLVLSPTMRCNLNCLGCSTRKYSKSEDLDIEIVDRILTEAKQKMGIHFIVTQGGEMFVYEDMWKLYQKHNDVYFQVYTNGTLIDKEAARRLAELGNVAPIISLEGFKEQTDARRGKGVFDKCMQAMDNLKEEGVLFGASITHTRVNSDIVTSLDFMDMLISKGAFIVWYFQFLPIGKDPDVNLMPTPLQRQRLRNFVEEVRATRPIFIGDFWNDGPFVGGCIAAGRRYVHINHKGDVEPCAFVHFAVDNIREKSLIEALQSDFFKFLRSKQPFAENLYAPCMIIDNPYILREAVKNFKAYPTHEGAEKVLEGEVAQHLDRYSSELKELTKSAWEEWKASQESPEISQPV
ncbi:MAG TPA: radical SAM protein [Candidatus Omnitrophica bacterium]|nr:radical SAM protein [Candidatus Omnitrophota bacterium]